VESLKGKIVLVTGGGRGIGRAIALAFASRGGRVIVSGRTDEALQGVAREIRSAGGEALPLLCDITREEEVESLRRRIADRFGAVEILINNAGVAPAAAFLEMETRVWKEVLDTNLTGAYHCCKILLPAMIAARWGRIINIASTAGKVGYSHASAYTASKHGLLGLTRALALEFARAGVTVNAICPGYVDTDLTAFNAQRMAEKTGKPAANILEIFKRTSPQNRLIAAEEVADLAVMLASDAGGAITGQAINIDGGAVMT
jgi:NAD(P)-dependent dehydrogenase (short-subunit alcohol dehydrogenase family)